MKFRHFREKRLTLGMNFMSINQSQIIKEVQQGYFLSFLLPISRHISKIVGGIPMYEGRQIANFRRPLLHRNNRNLEKSFHCFSQNNKSISQEILRFSRKPFHSRNKLQGYQSIINDYRREQYRAKRHSPEKNVFPQWIGLD
ncbi:hypothetical protein T01_13135 [Trichinella spiralis]|uniref:Uncharacterized protein n=1 Tax=Trichinella spiralis TaxID=6334 RepID=A0A0V1BCR8_TRISP|nr:hypothetical protein T01_13135 [Trichinella spiralis]